jgi:small-conductance mechanosensitive channel
MAEFLVWLERFAPLVRTVIVVGLVYIIFNVISTIIKRGLLKKARTRKQKSNIEIFSRIVRYAFFVILIVLAVNAYADDWTGFGLTVGLLSAALGWALQRPITGIAGWIMIILKRPFDIGDRIHIAGVKGDVKDITLTHVYLEEVGGTFDSEENSGRVILIPNSILFEQNIINYELTDEFVLDQVVVTITFESNLDKAIRLAQEAAVNVTKARLGEVKRVPYIRVYFNQTNGITVSTRYYSPAKMRPEMASKITKAIFDRFIVEKDIEIAYPHTQVILRHRDAPASWDGGKGTPA